MHLLRQVLKRWFPATLAALSLLAVPAAMKPALAEFAPGTRVPTGASANQTLRWNGTAWVFAGLLDDGVNQSTAGLLTTGGVASTGPATFTASAVGVVPVLIKMASGQTANPLEVDTSTGSVLVRIASNGELYVPSNSILHSTSGVLNLASGSSIALSLNGAGCTAQGGLTVVGTHKANLINSVTGFQFNSAAGVTATVPLAKLTTGGTNGSLTIQGGIITAATAPT